MGIKRDTEAPLGWVLRLYRTSPVKTAHGIGIESTLISEEWAPRSTTCRTRANHRAWQMNGERVPGSSFSWTGKVGSPIGSWRYGFSTSTDRQWYGYAFEWTAVADSGVVHGCANRSSAPFLPTLWVKATNERVHLIGSTSKGQTDVLRGDGTHQRMASSLLTEVAPSGADQEWTMEPATPSPSDALEVPTDEDIGHLDYADAGHGYVSTNELAFVFSAVHQERDMDPATLARVARYIRSMLPTGERAAFTDGATMSGLELDTDAYCGHGVPIQGHDCDACDEGNAQSDLAL